jgi:CRP/FNR family transcriptional regulator
MKYSPMDAARCSERFETIDEMTLSYENPLTYLPHKPVQEYAKTRIIYDVQHPAAGLYLVILGRVKVGTTANDGGQAVVRMVRSEGLFGESSLIGPLNHAESAIALDNVTLISWSRDEIERQVEREPRLGIALARYLVRQCLGLQDRIESMAVCKTPERVMLGLLQLAADLGAPMPDGSLRVASLTHHTIAEFVGTSREIVTFQMNRLRRMGLVRYTRKHLDVDTQALRENLRQQGISVPDGAIGAAQIAAGGRMFTPSQRVLDVKSVPEGADKRHEGMLKSHLMACPERPRH